MKRHRLRNGLLGLVTLSALFVAAAVMQHWFVGRQVYKETDQQLARWAKDVERDFAPEGKWDVSSMRQTALTLPMWYVIGRDGLLLDAEGNIPSIIRGVHTIGDSIVGSPRTVVTSIGERWRLLAKRLGEGAAIAGVSSPQNLKDADRKLRDNLGRIGSTFADAVKVRGSSIDIDVDWAVINGKGELVVGFGGVPLNIDVHSLLGPLDTVWVKTIVLRDSSYRVHSRPIRDEAGNVLGAAIVPLNITPRLRTLSSLDKFNSALAIALLAVTVAMGLWFLGREFWRDRGAISLEDALKVGESKTVEFKSSFAWDTGRGRENPALRLKVLKSIAGFLNADGGTLFIGVEEDKLGHGHLRGIDEDLRLAGGNKDKLRLNLANLITTQMGHAFARFITDRIEQAEDQFYWVVYVERSTKVPAFVHWEEQDRFFVREGPKTNELTTKSAWSYIRERWR